MDNQTNFRITAEQFEAIRELILSNKFIDGSGLSDLKNDFLNAKIIKPEQMNENIKRMCHRFGCTIRNKRTIEDKLYFANTVKSLDWCKKEAFDC